MDKTEIQKRILEEEDYIRCPKLGNSLNRFTAKNSEGVENGTIARLLLLSEEEVDKLYREAVGMLRKIMVENE
jgi:hypothetical protein